MADSGTSLHNGASSTATGASPTSPAKGISRLTWPVVFFCEAALVITLVVLIVLFSVPTERKLMDTVRDLYHAKEVKYDQYKDKSNVYTMMNFDERRKGNGALKDDLMDNVEMRFMYHDRNTRENWELNIMSLHFSSHNKAREYFNSFEYADPKAQADRTPTDWYEYSDSRVKELATNGTYLRETGSGSNAGFECYIMYLEGSSVVLIRFEQMPTIDDARRDRLTELCDALSLPDPFDLENTWEEHQQ